MCELPVALLAECVFMATKRGREVVARELRSLCCVVNIAEVVPSY